MVWNQNGSRFLEEKSCRENRQESGEGAFMQAVGRGQPPQEQGYAIMEAENNDDMNAYLWLCF